MQRGEREGSPLAPSVKRNAARSEKKGVEEEVEQHLRACSTYVVPSTRPPPPPIAVRTDSKETIIPPTSFSSRALIARRKKRWKKKT